MSCRLRSCSLWPRSSTSARDWLLGFTRAGGRYAGTAHAAALHARGTRAGRDAPRQASAQGDDRGAGAVRVRVRAPCDASARSGATTQPLLGGTRRHSRWHRWCAIRYGRPAVRRVPDGPHPGPGGPARASQMVIVNVGLRVVAFALAGLLVSRTLWIAVMLLLPVAWAGVWAGTGGDGAPDRRSTVLDWGRADLAHVLGSCLAQAARSVHVECNVARRDSVLNVRCSPSAAAAWWPDWH
jgi:hypothetical protein